MTQSTAEIERDAAFERLSKRFNFSLDAVQAMSAALARGDQRMAQFDHPDFGGHGQWMRGGMLMIGDMFNDDLKARVAGLCEELTKLPAAETSEQRPRAPSTEWWPAELGRPHSSGGQNDMRYAYFADARRLAIDRAGTVTVYDTGDHEIFGVAQQQSRDATLTFSSQHGPIDLSQLSRV